jgi:simple sugar transport system ATP-binding protein
VAAGTVDEFDRTSLVRAMTGKPLTDTQPSDSVRANAPPVLAVEGLTLRGVFEDVSFSVRPGEVVGVTGLLGSGRTEIAETLFGIRRAEAGRIEVDGKPVRIRRVRDAVRAGIGYVPADRLTQGVFLDQPISLNIVAGSLDRLVGRLDLLRRREAARVVDRASRDFRIVMSSSAAPVRSLSGGNQQRVVLSKWLTRNPRILMLNGPTVGVDVASKHEILDMLRTKADEGVAVLVISDDVPELVAVCHRVLVVRRGRIADVLEGDRLQEDEIVRELVA